MNIVRSPVSLSQRSFAFLLMFSWLFTSHAAQSDTAADQPASSTQAVLSPAVSPLVSPSVSPFPEPTTVEELLRLDTEAALQTARRAAAGPFDAPALAGHPARPERRVPTGNSVVAIYGTGRALTAEVLIGPQLLVFQSLRRRPVSGGASAYALDLIHPPCVHLSNGQKKEVLCLDQGKP